MRAEPLESIGCTRTFIAPTMPRDKDSLQIGSAENSLIKLRLNPQRGRRPTPRHFVLSMDLLPQRHDHETISGVSRRAIVVFVGVVATECGKRELVARRGGGPALCEIARRGRMP